MARLIWIGVGAVGGVYAYRKGEQVVDTVRQQGIAGTAQAVAAAAVQSASSMRAQTAGANRDRGQSGLRLGGFRITRAYDPPAPTLLPAAIMDTGVIDITDVGRRDTFIAAVGHQHTDDTDAGRLRTDTARRRKAR